MKSAGVPSLISNDVIMRGNVTSSGEVQFDGNLEGDIKASSLIIGDKASVRGEVVCESVIVRGRVEGGIRARSVSLASTAHILGGCPMGADAEEGVIGADCQVHGYPGLYVVEDRKSVV